MVNNTFDKIMEEVEAKVSKDAESTYSEPHKAPLQEAKKIKQRSGTRFLERKKKILIGRQKML